ncbi:MAG TPA: 5'-nucleotidase C-terminal domain-containing protein [Bryobacteraceae bacterium]|nr:5'-nucleotidase C-terminal domain-containing protein [Bryobacteraceae bacterium]
MRLFISLIISLTVILPGYGAAMAPDRTTVTVLATTDLHGNLYPVDYYTAAPAARGLARIATLIQQVRATAPGALLFDCGDTIQGTPMESVYQTIVRTGRPPLGLDFDPALLPGDPMMLAMNRLRYDAMVLGNHEFNFGLKSLARARADARFPWLSANTSVAPGNAEQPFPSYIVKNAGGIRVAFIGITTPAIPGWERPEHIGGYRFGAGRPALERALGNLRRAGGADLVIVGAHMGLEGQGAIDNIVAELAIPGVDAIIFGHTHREEAGKLLGGVLAVQPKNWGMSLARLDFTLERAGAGWKLVDRASRLIPVSADTPADPEILRLTRPYHELTERYLDTPVARADAPLSAALGRVRDTALVDAIHAVQLHYARADVSLTALFNPRVRVSEGPVTVRQVAALYIYENELYAVEGTGRMVKEALENAARYFLSCQGESCGRAPLISGTVAGFNFDTAQGVEYEIDLTRPEGDRVRNLRRHGRPLDPDQKLRIAINNYRAGGSAGYGMFRGAPVVWRSSEEIRDLIIRYYTERGKLPAEPDHNWRILPAEAARTLEANPAEAVNGGRRD